MEQIKMITPNLTKFPDNERYIAALALVIEIDATLARGWQHYRNKAGELLTTLDQVVLAILDDDLAVTEPAKL
jgi:hypothetical protein